MTECCNIQKTQTSPAQVERVSPGLTYRPCVDIIEHEQELLVVADVPGADPEHIDVRYERGELTLCAPVRPRQPDEARFLLREYGVGDFCRTFQVGEDIDASAITAESKNGVLTLHLPKRESARPRKIKVATAG